MKAELTKEERKERITQALTTDEGKRALAMALTDTISSCLHIYGISEEYLFDIDNPRERMLRCIVRYEDNLAKGKVFTEYIIDAMDTIYEQLEIEPGTTKKLLNPEIVKKIEELDPIESRFDILDL